MDPLILLAIDLVAVSALVFGLYFPRHRRRDLLIAFLTVNVGVLAVSLVLGSSAVGAGLGLGLFGVLSIIRLRSSEVQQHEVAYYFAALALGLIGGLGAGLGWAAPALMALVVGVLAAVDNGRVLRRYRQQLVVLDRALPDEGELREHLEAILGGRVRAMRVERLDLVNDTTTVDVRYELHQTASRREPVAA
ncbi:DUF4956 domain-containing protein [Agromyces sp. Marseille-Q5079]|uniref:DUF4956 domain-containing protein n=1 Tax=Agromyces sp. Marseille-Q5079 TaxID=3439059 RepID=UPI003D9CB593